jgi:hypothetical protein
MATARRVPPGVLATPAQVGAKPVRICQLSGLRATSSCAAQMDEWFAPGTEPTREDDWERDGRVTLPAEYADWARQGVQPAMGTRNLALGRGPGMSRDSAGSGMTASVEDTRFRMLSPRDGDRYAIPSGVEARYASIPLRTGGANQVRWTIDGRAFEGDRWALTPGPHVIRATSGRGEVAEARIVVER